MKEIWKDIPWFNWKYQASNLWRIKSITKLWKRIVKWYYKKYIKIAIWSEENNWNKLYSAHRLIASTFLWLNLNDYNMIVCHKDDNWKNNNIENLFLWTRLDNNRDKMNKWRWIRWIKMWSCKLKENDVIEIRKSNKNQRELWKIYWVSVSTIWNIKNFKSWRHIN